MTSFSPVDLKNPDRRDHAGPFDIIGDVHGCADELAALLSALGYFVRFAGRGDDRHAVTSAPPGRRAIFVGDLVDRGPNAPDVFRIVMGMTRAGHAWAVEGNHDVKFLRWLGGRQSNLTHGLDRTVAQFATEASRFHGEVKHFLSHLPSPNNCSHSLFAPLLAKSTAGRSVGRQGRYFRTHNQRCCCCSEFTRAEAG